MLEMEQKYRVEDLSSIERILVESGAEYLGEESQTDIFLNATDRDFAASDEVLRLRTIGNKSTITYKGPRRSGQIKIRKETEVEIIIEQSHVREQVIDLFRCLKYHPVAKIQKTRQVWRCRFGGVEFNVCLDLVPEIGQFIELEALTDEEQIPNVRVALAQAEQALGLKVREQRSYLRMNLEHRGF